MTAWCFVHVADMQPGSPRSYRFDPRFAENWMTARQQIMREKPDLVLVGGDITRDGYIHEFEFEEMKASLEGMGIPYHAVPGNMDTGNKHAHAQGPSSNRDDVANNVTADELNRYMRHFGEFPWSFVHKNIRFSGFYAAVAGAGLPHEQAMWAWLEGLADLPPADHHVLIMHYTLFIDDPDEPNFDITSREDYHNWYFGIDQPHRGRMLDAFKAGGVSIVLSGHIHCRRPVQVVDGIRFYKAPATGFPQWGDRWPDGDDTLGFYRFDVTDAGVAERFIPLERVSTAKGVYGPGGHPTPEMRDYSLAWVKDDVNRRFWDDTT